MKRHEKQTEDGTEFNLLTYIPFQLVRTQLNLHGTLRTENAPSVKSIATLSKTEFRVFTLIASTKDQTPSEIANTFGFDRAVVARAIATLVNKNLIETEPIKSDLRSKSVKLTQKGTQMAATANKIMSVYGAHLDNALTPDEKAMLFSILEKLLAANEAFSEQDLAC